MDMMKVAIKREHVVMLYMATGEAVVPLATMSALAAVDDGREMMTCDVAWLSCQRPT